MESVVQVSDIDNLYTNLYSKYQLDKVISKQKREFSDIDQLISNISSLGSDDNVQYKYGKKKKVVYKDSKVFLSSRLYNFLRVQDTFKAYGIYEEMNTRTIEQMFNNYWSYNKLSNTDNDIYNDIVTFQSMGRYERKTHVKAFIDKWTSKTKDIKISL